MATENLAARIGADLKTARRNRGLSVAEVAEAVGITSGAYRKVESGAVWARPDTMARLEKELGVVLNVEVACRPEHLPADSAEPRTQVRELRERCAGLKARLKAARQERDRIEARIESLERELRYTREAERAAHGTAMAFAGLCEAVWTVHPAESAEWANKLRKCASAWRTQSTKRQAGFMKARQATDPAKAFEVWFFELVDHIGDEASENAEE